MSVSRTKLFIESIIIYGGIQAVNKLLPLFFLPVIVKMLNSPSEFGKYDMFTTLIALGSTITTLGVYDAGFRENFDKNSHYNTRQITGTITLLVFGASLILGFLILLFRSSFAKFFWGDTNYVYLISITIPTMTLTALGTIGIMPLRFRNDRKLYAFILLGNSIVHYLMTILFLKLNPIGESLIYATLITQIVLVVCLWAFQWSFFDIRRFSFILSKELLKVGLPLVPVFLSFWLLQSISRMLIVKDLGLDEQGIYSLGYRVASVSMIIQVAYTTGFSYFSFSTMDYKDQIENRTKLVRFMLELSLLFLGFMLLLQDLIFRLLFPPQYINALKVFPFLLFLPLLFILYQTISNQFTIAKKTYLSSGILFTGLGVTFLMNLLLIPKFSIAGAAFGTLCGYWSILILSYLVAIRIKLLEHDQVISILLASTLLVFILLFLNILNIYFLALLSLVVITFLSKKDLLEMKSKIVQVIRKKI